MRVFALCHFPLLSLFLFSYLGFLFVLVEAQGTSSIRVSADAYTSTTVPGTNYGAFNYVFVGQAGRYRAFLKFLAADSVPSLDPNAQLTSVTLRLAGARMRSGPQYHSFKVEGIASAAWGEGAVTYTTFDPPVGVFLGTIQFKLGGYIMASASLNATAVQQLLQESTGRAFSLSFPRDAATTDTGDWQSKDYMSGLPDSAVLDLEWFVPATTGVPTTGVPTTGVPTTGVASSSTTGVPRSTGVFTTGTDPSNTSRSTTTGDTVVVSSSSDASALVSVGLLIGIAAAVVGLLLLLLLGVVLRRRLRSEAHDSPSSIHSSRPGDDDGDIYMNVHAEGVFVLVSRFRLLFLKCAPLSLFDTFRLA
jgi:hypothetical protein